MFLKRIFKNLKDNLQVMLLLCRILEGIGSITHCSHFYKYKFKLSFQDIKLNLDHSYNVKMTQYFVLYSPTISDAR